MIIWPQYINKDLSYSQGRKVSLEFAVKEPNISDISKALKKLKIPHNVQKEFSYPGKWYEKSGRIIVESEDTSKIELLKEICLKIKEKNN